MCADEAVHLRYEAQCCAPCAAAAGMAQALVHAAHRAFLGTTARIDFASTARCCVCRYDSRGFRRDCQAIYRMVMRDGAARRDRAMA